MSIDRGDRVIHMMFRTLCGGCTNRGKVGDLQTDELTKGADFKKVFMICTQNIITRGLLGKLISSLEDKICVTMQMKMSRPTVERLAKTNLVKMEKRRPLEEVWMILMWSGKDAQNRVSETIRSFRSTYSLEKRDIYITETTAQAEAEERIWFDGEAQTSLTGKHENDNDKKVDEGEKVVEAKDEENGNGEGEHEMLKKEPEVEIIPMVPQVQNDEQELSASVEEIRSLHSEHLPAINSLNPSHIDRDQPIDKSEELDETAEVISNTADILQPTNTSIPAKTS